MTNHRAWIKRIEQQAAELLRRNSHGQRVNLTPIELLLGGFGAFRPLVIASAEAVGGQSLAADADHAFSDVPDNPVEKMSGPRLISADHARRVMMVCIDTDDRAEDEDPETFEYLFGGLGDDYVWPADPLVYLANRLGDRLPTAADSPGTWLGWAQAIGAAGIPER